VSVREMQRLASLGSRYSMICVELRPFTRALYRAASGWKNRQATFLLKEEAKQAIRMWRAMLFLLSSAEVVFGRNLETFRENPVISWIVEFDSSLEGSGGLLYRIDQDGVEVCLGGFAVALSSFGFADDSSYQNTAEYIGVILGLVALAKIGVRGVDVELRGDSITALTWAETGRPRGSLVTNASMVFTLLCVALGLTVRRSTHISGEKNWRCDTLSRTDEPLRETMDKIGRGDSPAIDIPGDERAMRLFALCSPSLCTEGEERFRAFWKEIRELLASMNDQGG
jgi:ribonuclease HI